MEVEGEEEIVAAPLLIGGGGVIREDRYDHGRGDLANLEILHNLDQREGLMGPVSHQDGQWASPTKEWLCHPLFKVADIERRAAAVKSA